MTYGDADLIHREENLHFQRYRKWIWIETNITTIAIDQDGLKAGDRTTTLISNDSYKFP